MLNIIEENSSDENIDCPPSTGKEIPNPAAIPAKPELVCCVFEDDKIFADDSYLGLIRNKTIIELINAVEKAIKK